MNLEHLKKTNPWLSLTKDNIALCDEEFFRQYGGVDKYCELIHKKDKNVEITFSCVPEPFSGNPQSKVFCLNKNPGKPDSCFFADDSFAEASFKNLRLEQDTCFWAENILNRCGKQHDGVKWLKVRTDSLEKILDAHPDIFFIEYFPYHSSKGFAFPRHLPSYEFSNCLIKEAMKEEKLIIIMREKKEWLDRIDDLSDYQHLYTLKCAQGGYLTPKNIVRIDKKGKEHYLSEKAIKEYFEI